VTNTVPTNVRGFRRYTIWEVKIFFDKIDAECKHSDFLWGLRESLFSFVETNYEQYLLLNAQMNQSIKNYLHRRFELFYEQVCLKVQSFSNSYYLSLWKSLSHDEQRTLYDIATDDIINPSNRDIALTLCDLGLVKSIENIAGFEIMNTSFRNYIFTQLDQSEIQIIQKEAQENGSWNNLGVPLLLVVIGLCTFLFITQRDAFSNLITYLGAATGSIAALLRILGMIPNAKT
jgi:hypothetical protein